ncbi:hypothetical protein HHK36_031682 [Tetracentron sinense]|uniref:N-acetyltransferase domain-containing protein n=1 Tax=Tetracentron sinense TaxID=13715 RepID=A0A834YBP6_TETSI|nr:hypothetical protein HHK36_031682 [Tetracentron sinense]
MGGFDYYRSGSFVLDAAETSLGLESEKYCTLLLKSNSIEGSEKVIAAATYQIIPADTKYAEIPLAAVHSNYQHKGIGHLLYMELRKRLQNVGICTIFCWGDKESEGFWLKQGFVPIAEVDVRGRARRLPIKADIRRSLCFPGGSTLMVSHLNKDISIPANPSDSLKVCFPLKLHVKLPSSVPFKGEGLGGIMEYHDTPKSLNQFIPEIENPRLQMFVKDGCSTDDNKFEGSSHIHDSIQGCTDLVPWNGLDCNNTVTDLGMAENGDDADVKHCSCSAPGLKKRVWEASWSSLKSKKVKGGHHIDCHLDSDWDFVSEHGRENGSCFGGCSRGTSRVKSLVEAEPIPKDSLEIPCMTIHAEESSPVPIMSNKDQISEEFQSKDECLKSC